MQNIKIMFKSPRFVTGFILVMIVVLYAIFWPMINTADPKADRVENPNYALIEPLRGALAVQDDQLIENEINALLALDDNEDIITVAQNVQQALEKGGLSNALSGSKQVKKSNPLYQEFANLRLYLGADSQTPADVELAKTELERLTVHHKAIVEINDLMIAGKYDEALLKAKEIGGEEVENLVMLLTEQKLDEAAKESTTLLSQHEATYKWIIEISNRLDAGGYDDAKEALTKIQKTLLVPKDSPPSQMFWLGTDNFSRDIFLEMAYGARLSLTVGAIAGIVATFIGLVLGLVAGFVGGWLDNVINTLTNIFIVIPSMIVLILISVALGSIREGWITGIVIGLTAWPWTARSVRAQTTSLRYRDHVNMARITGYGTAKIIVTEILPYIASYVVMAFILQVASGIMSEATLAILGLGDPTAISLGRMLNWAQQYEAIRSGRWWQFVPVAVTITMVSFGLYMMNSGMDEVFNPKIRS